MKVEKIEVLGMSFALEAMRQPFLSESKDIQSNLALAQKLIKSGNEHRKFMRQITVNIHVCASMCWFAEFDTYKVGCTRNSQSFWNTFKGEFTDDDFVQPTWQYLPGENSRGLPYSAKLAWMEIISKLNFIKELGCPKEILRYLVPQGIKYSSMVTMTGETFLNILKQRQNHRLPEWHQFLLQSMELMSHMDSDACNFLKMILPSIDKESKVGKLLVNVVDPYNEERNIFGEYIVTNEQKEKD